MFTAVDLEHHLSELGKRNGCGAVRREPFMAVIVKYVVVRDGKEEMIFTTKKEADAYDKMLDVAERLNAFLQAAGVDIAEDKLDELTFFMAQHRDPIGRLLKGGTLDVPVAREPAASSEAIQEETAGADTVESKTRDAAKRARTSKSKVVA
jgi:dsDNA-binding SOS-regulon protein